MEEKIFYKGIKTRIYPNKFQQKRINMTFAASTMIWNYCLNELKLQKQNYFLHVALMYQNYVLPKFIQLINSAKNDLIFNFYSKKELNKYYEKNINLNDIYSYNVHTLNTYTFNLENKNFINKKIYNKSTTQYGLYRTNLSNIKFNTANLRPVIVQYKNYKLPKAYNKLAKSKVNQMIHSYREQLEKPWLAKMNEIQLRKNNNLALTENYTYLDWIAYHRSFKKGIFSMVKRNLSQYDLGALITQYVNQPKNKWMKYCDSVALRYPAEKITNTLNAFFKGQAGYPKYKSLYFPNKSFRSNNTIAKNKDGSIKSQSIDLIDQYNLKLPKMKGKIKNKNHSLRTLIKCNKIKLDSTMTIKSATISTDTSGKYYVSLTVSYIPKKVNKTGKSIGIDMNIDNFLTDSNGKIVKTKDYNNKYSINLLNWSKKFSREDLLARNQIIKESHNYQKIVNQGGISHTHKVKKMKDYKNRRNSNAQIKRIKSAQACNRKVDLHELSNYYVHNYDVIVLEDLSVSNMIKNKHLSKSIANQSWTMFKTMLQYKCEAADKKLVLVDPKYTTQTCHDCGYRMGSDDQSEKLTLADRSWTCPSCNTYHIRDKNAAKNILTKGLNLINND